MFSVALICIACFLLRVPYFRITLEQNGGTALYNSTFGVYTPLGAGTWGWHIVLQAIHRSLRVLGVRGFMFIRIAQAGFDCVTCLGIYLLSRLLWQDEQAALFSAGVWAAFGAFPQMIPWFTNAERLTVMYMVWGVFLWMSGYPIAAGVLFGVSFLTKTPSGLEFIGIAFGMAFTPKTYIAAFAVLAAFFLYLTIRGRKSEYLSAINHFRRYKKADTAIERGGNEPLIRYGVEVISAIGFVWICALTALTLNPMPVLVYWLCAAFTGLMIQKVYVNAHWTPVFAVLCVASGGVLMSENLTYLAFTLFFSAILAWLYARESVWTPSYYESSMGAGTRMAVKYLTDNTKEGDYIFLWGWSPQVYTLSGRQSACPELCYCGTDYLKTYIPDYKEKLLAAINERKPVCIMSWGEFPLHLRFAHIRWIKDTAVTGNVEVWKLVYPEVKT